jgi:hypothetical protein
MTTLEQITRTAAEAAGFTVDTGCYPWFGYKGARFAPDEHVRVFTDLEAALMEQLTAARQPGLPEDNLTFADLRTELLEIEDLSTQGHETEARLAVAHKRLLDATYRVLLLTPYKFCAGAADADDHPYLDLFFQRILQGESARWYVAEIHVQVDWDTIAITGRIVHVAERWRLYDEAVSVAVFADKRSDRYVDLLASLLKQLDEQVERVLALENAKDPANAANAENVVQEPV